MANSPELLRDSSGFMLIVDQGESAEVTITLTDADSGTLAKASISTLVITHTLAGTETVINSRNAQSVLDANNGTVSAEGVLTLKLQPADNTALVAAIGDVEEHWLHLQWTWTDGGGDPMSGGHVYRYYVKAINNDALTASTVAWVQ